MTPQHDELASVHLIVDAIEGRVARVELPDGTTVDWPVASLPRGVLEGDVVTLTVEGGDVDVEIDRAATRERRHRAQAQLDALNADGPTERIDV